MRSSTTTSSIVESSQHEDNPLDTEFRNVLYIIKPYIQHIDDPFKIEQYRIWLDKLSNTGSSDKLCRNKYLSELSEQIRNNVVLPPFDKPPPRGILSPYKKYPNNNQLSRAESCVSRKMNKSTKSALGIKERRRKIEESSWCDLTDSVTVSQTSLDGGGGRGGSHKNADKKNTEIPNCGDFDVRESLKMTYENLYNLDEKETDLASLKSISQNTKSIGEVEALRTRIQDLEDIKSALKDTQCMTEDRKRMMECLQTKLLAYESKNKELRSIVDLQTKRILELELNKPKSQLDMVIIEDIKEKCAKDIEAVKKKYTNELKEKDIKYYDKLQAVEIEYQKRLEYLEKQHEHKIKDTVGFRDAILKQKDEEIASLRDQLKKHIEEETTYSEIVVHLKKCIGKMDKLMVKSERDYRRRIDELKQELEKKDVETEMKLQQQKAELALHHSTVKQDEITDAINNLERKYMAMLEKQKCQSLEIQNQNQKVIGELANLLKQEANG